MASIARNGASIAYDEAGAGAPAFVFLHGWVCNRTFWRPQFEDLSRDHRCIAVDLRGCGESTGPGPYDPVAAADDVAALIEHLGAAPAVIVGHSLGGIVALLLNERHPGLVLGAVLPQLLPQYFLYLGNVLMMYAVLALGLDLLLGWAGQFAFGRSLRHAEASGATRTLSAPTCFADTETWASFGETYLRR